MKLLWDAVGTEFGARHELYEMNYSGSHELVRVFPLQQAQASGALKRWRRWRALHGGLRRGRLAAPGLSRRLGHLDRGQGMSRCGSPDDREQPAPAYRQRPAPDVPGGLAVADREKDDLCLADEVLERHVATAGSTRLSVELSRLSPIMKKCPGGTTYSCVLSRNPLS